MATVDFNTVPSGVTLNEERIQQLSDRAAETATAFNRKLEKLSATVAEARDNYSREADELIKSSSPEDRAAARKAIEDYLPRLADISLRDVRKRLELDKLAPPLPSS